MIQNRLTRQYGVLVGEHRRLWGSALCALSRSSSLSERGSFIGKGCNLDFPDILLIYHLASPLDHCAWKRLFLTIKDTMKNNNCRKRLLAGNGGFT